jgi:hypothetical protein
MSDFNVPAIKQAVKNLAAKGCEIQKEISLLRRTRPSAPDARSSHGYLIQEAVVRKKSKGYCSRYHQLAYAFARGKLYLYTEMRVHPGNEPSPRVIADVLMDFLKGTHTQDSRYEFKQSLQEDVQQWLRAKVVEKAA